MALLLTNDKAEGTIKSTMAGWKSKQRSKIGRGSTTPGRQKGATCQASALDRYMAKSSRSYKHLLYGAWCLRKRG